MEPKAQKVIPVRLEPRVPTQQFLVRKGLRDLLVQQARLDQLQQFLALLVLMELPVHKDPKAILVLLEPRQLFQDHRALKVLRVIQVQLVLQARKALKVPWDRWVQKVQLELAVMK
jgi:hypothetical protein